MKKIKMLIVSLLCLSLCSCSLLLETKPREVKHENNQHAYMEAYRQNIQNVIAEYGKYQDNTPGAPVKGLKYGKLVDFEKDDTPELVLLHDMTVKVYRFDGNSSYLVYDQPLGCRFGQTDVSYTFAINETAPIPCLITYQTRNEWWSEELHIFTVQNGSANTKMLLADAYVPGKESDGPCDAFHTYKINGANVSKKEYFDAYNDAQDGKKEIDACYGDSTHLDVQANEDQLDAFLSDFGL